MSDVTSSVEELEEQRDFLLRSLDDLEAELAAGDIEPGDYATLRDDYTARAAAVLRALDERRAGRGRRPEGPEAAESDLGSVDHRNGGGSSPERRVGAAGPRRGLQSRRVRRAGVVAGILAFAVLAGVLVAHGSGERTAGQSASGSITSTPAAPASDVDKAQQLFAGGKPLEALQTLNGAVQKNPKDVAALTFLGWFTRLTAKQVNHPELIDKAMTYLVRAEEADPSYGPAHLFRGIVLLDDLNQPAAAVPEIQTFLAAPHTPDEQAMVPTAQSTLARAVAAANGGGPTTTPASTPTP